MVPAALLDALIQKESAGNPLAVSPAGAMGLAQAMPATARDPGFGVKPLADPFDPQESRRFAGEYLGAMLRKYDGNPLPALAAYNWGPGNVDMWLRGGGDMNKLPAETRDYVATLLPVAQSTMGGGQQPAGGHDRMQLLLEAERRGILPDNMRQMLDEARRRGLVPGGGDEGRLPRSLSEAQPDAGSVMGDIGNVLEQGAYGFNERIADFIEAPGALASAVVDPILDMIPGVPAKPPEEPGAVSQFLRGGEQPTTTAQRVARRVGQEVGATVPLAAIPYAAAAAPIRAPAANLGQGVVQSMVRGIQNSPALAAQGELAATIGAGTGAGIAREVAPGSGTAEAVGQIAGGLSPIALAHTPAALATRAARSAWSRVSPQAQTEAAQREVARVLGPEMTPAAAEHLADADTLRQAMPGFSPTLAEATGSPALVATQRRIEGQAQGADLEQMASRRAASEAAVDRFARENAPASERSIDYVVDAAGMKIRGVADTVGQQARGVEARQSALADSLPVADKSAAGQTIRERLKAERDRTRQEMSRLADELGINDADVAVPFGKAADDIINEFSPQSVFDDVSNYPAILDAVRKAGAPRGGNEPAVTFKDLKALRERVSDDLIDAQAAGSPSRKKIRTLAMLKERVDNILDELVEEAAPGLAERYRQFRDTYRQEYIERFENAAAFKSRHQDGRGFYRTPDEKVAEAFFGAGEVTAARSFNEVFRGDPAATAALENVALDNLRSAAVRGGKVDPLALRSWVTKHRSVLDEFPSIKAAVSDVESASTRLAERQAQLDGRAKRIEDEFFARQVAAVERGNKTPEQVIDAGLRDPRAMQTLVRRLRGNDEALAGLRRHLWDRVAGEDASTIKRFLDRHDRSLRAALGVEHVGHLKQIAQAREMLERVPAPAGRGYEPNPLADLERNIGMGVPQIGSRIFAAESGRTSYRYIATDAFGRFVRGRSRAESEALLRQALYDPDVARDLSALIRAKGERPDVTRRLNAYLFNAGVTSTEDQ